MPGFHCRAVGPLFSRQKVCWAIIWKEKKQRKEEFVTQSLNSCMHIQFRQKLTGVGSCLSIYKRVILLFFVSVVSILTSSWHKKSTSAESNISKTWNESEFKVWSLWAVFLFHGFFFCRCFSSYLFCLVMQNANWMINSIKLCLN